MAPLRVSIPQSPGNPVYLYIVICWNILTFKILHPTGDSGCSDIRGMEMSVSQRVEGITSQLPMFYCLMRPHISLVPSVATNGTDCGQLTHGINWSEGDSSLEVVDGLEGKTIEE